MKETDHLPSNPDIPFEHQMLHILRFYAPTDASRPRTSASAVPAEAVAQANEALRQDNARLRRTMRSLEKKSRPSTARSNT